MVENKFQGRLDQDQLAQSKSAKIKVGRYCPEGHVISSARQTHKSTTLRVRKVSSFLQHQPCRNHKCGHIEGKEKNTDR